MRTTAPLCGVLTMVIATVLGLYAAQDATGSVKAVPADAHPVFSVVTVKPSDPNNTNWALAIRGTHFISTNTTVDDLISFAYGVHIKQIVGGPEWLHSAKYDIEGVPDQEGKPNRQQLASMIQGLLADRFKLALHRGRKELAVYALTVGKNGPKLTKSAAAPDGPSGYGFGPFGTMRVTNMTMAAFASAMQRTVLDKPLVDRTGLSERYDFTLKWTPDDSQFNQIRGPGEAAPTSGEDPNAPPGLYAAIQEELGLKVEPV
jgi:uncharacterized protein (TIGR03435 family)